MIKSSIPAMLNSFKLDRLMRRMFMENYTPHFEDPQYKELLGLLLADKYIYLDKNNLCRLTFEGGAYYCKGGYRNDLFFAIIKSPFTLFEYIVKLLLPWTR